MKKYFYSGVECTLNCEWHDKVVIYLLRFPGGGLYIGQTIQFVGTRIKQHCIDAFQDRNYRYDNPKNRAIRKYKKFTVEVIEKCSSVDETNIREDVIINEYKSKGLKLYNTASGGLNNCEYFGVKCVVADNAFNIVRVFDKIKDANKFIDSSGCNTSTIDKYKLIKNKYFLLSYDDYISLKPFEHKRNYDLQVENKRIERIKNKKTAPKIHYNVAQIDHRYNLVSIIDIHEVLERYGESIRSRMNKHVYGYYWMREEEYNKLISLKKPLQSVLVGLKYIYKVNKHKEIIGEYRSIIDASNESNHSVQSITNNIKLKSYISDEYFFIMSDEYKDVDLDYVNRITVLEQTSEPKRVYEYDKDHNLINTYSSINECARAKRVSQKTISARARTNVLYRGFYLTH